MKGRVHYNLTRRVWSVYAYRRGGKRNAMGWFLHCHMDTLALADVVPVVAAATIARIRKAYATTGKPQREICARLEGTLTDLPPNVDDYRVVRFNPYTTDTFQWDDGTTYEGSALVVLPSNHTHALAR